MRIGDADIGRLPSRDLSETLVRLGLAAFLLIVCWRVFAPFAQLFLWGLVLAVALYPLQQRLF